MTRASFLKVIDAAGFGENGVFTRRLFSTNSLDCVWGEGAGPLFAMSSLRLFLSKVTAVAALRPSPGSGARRTAGNVLREVEGWLRRLDSPQWRCRWRWRVRVGGKTQHFQGSGFSQEAFVEMQAKCFQKSRIPA